MRKSIVIFGIVMSIILGSLVSAPSVAAPLGTPFMQEEIDAIQAIIQEMQDELNNLHVPWGNVTGKPVGFANDTNTGGIFQKSASTVVEPCDVGDVVTWNGTHWVCDDIGVVASNVVVLHYEQTGEVTLPLTPAGVTSVFTLLAEWKIVKGMGFVYDDVSTVLYDSSVYADINGGVDIGWYKSVDGMIWKKIDRISASTGAFKVQDEFGFQNNLRPTDNYIAFAATNPFPDTASKVKDFSGTITIHLPPGQSLMRLK